MSKAAFPGLFSPVKIGNVELKNRIVHSPHGTYAEDEQNFLPQREADYHIARARGGMGLLIFGDTNIETTGSPSVTLANPLGIPLLRDMVDECHFWGAKMFTHLHHQKSDNAFQLWRIKTGQAIGELPTVSGESPEPGLKARQITVDEIAEIHDYFGTAAFNAREAGFDGVCINGAYGFTPGQFLSPVANKRKDQYGGDARGRTRFLTEMFQKIKAAAGADFPIMLKISAEELREDGTKINDTLEHVRILEEGGLDALFVVAGIQTTDDLHRALPSMGSVPFGCFVPYAEAVKKVVSIPVMVGTRINDPVMAESIVQENKADMIALSRGSIADPEWTNKAKKGLVEDINKCIYCNRCLAGVFPAYHHHIRCSVNPSAYRERAYKIRPAEIKKNILIAGAGPAGMEAARVAVQRGHKVTLCEKSGQLGGQLLLAAKSPHKDEIAQLTAYLTHQIDKLDIDVMLDTEVTPELVTRMKPDAVIIATGAVPNVPDLPGITNANVVTAWDVIDGKAKVSGNIVVAGGGMVGCEAAELLVMNNCKVTIVEMLEKIAADVEPTQRMFLMERFGEYKLDIVTDATIEGFSETGVKVKGANGNSSEIAADYVVLALGASPDNALAARLEDELDELYIIGDCRRPYRILEAVHDGAYIAREI